MESITLTITDGDDAAKKSPYRTIDHCLPEYGYQLRILDIIREHNLFIAGGYARSLSARQTDKWMITDDPHDMMRSAQVTLPYGDIDIYGFTGSAQMDTVGEQLRQMGYNQEWSSQYVVSYWHRLLPTVQLIGFDDTIYPMRQRVIHRLELFTLSVERVAFYWDWRKKPETGEYYGWRLIAHDRFLTDVYTASVTLMAFRSVNEAQTRITKYEKKGFKARADTGYVIAIGLLRMTEDQRRASIEHDFQKTGDPYSSVFELDTIDVSDLADRYFDDLPVLHGLVNAGLVGEDIL